MKKQEFKKLVKECVREILFDEGVLSNLVAEVAFGLTKAQNMLNETPSEQKAPAPVRESESLREQKESRNRLIAAMKTDSMKNIFENVDPIKEKGVPGSTPVASPLSGVAPSDPGVDISGLLKVSKDMWNKLK